MDRDATEKEVAQAHELIEEMFSHQYEKMKRYAEAAIYGASQGDPGRAEEIVQEAMITAINKPLDFIYSENPTGWLMNTIRNTAQNAIRAEQRMVKLMTEYRKLANTQTSNAHDVNFLFYGLIPDEDLKLLEQVYLEGYSYRELEKQKKLTPSALAMRIKRAKAKFIKNYIMSSEKFDTRGHNKTGRVQYADEA